MSRSHGGETEGQKRYRQSIVEAAEGRQVLLDEKKFSISKKSGELVITVSGAEGSKKQSPEAHEKEYNSFLDEALRLKADYEAAQTYGAVVIRPTAVRRQIVEDVANPEVAGHIFIGHGCLARIWLDEGEGRHDFNWHDMSRATQESATPHLKQGDIIQRTCGHLPGMSKKNQVVPLGTFALRDLSKLSIAINTIIRVEDPADSIFRPVFNDTAPVLELIERINTQFRDVEPFIFDDPGLIDRVPFVDLGVNK